MKYITFTCLLFLSQFCINAQQLTLETDLDTAVNESSGLIYLNNTLITHNDSEGAAQLFDIDITSGTVTRTVTIANATNVDWEDLAFDDNYIYIGDFGNYEGHRTNLKVYRISITDYFNNTSVTADVTNFTYSNQTDFTPAPLATNFDAEALIHYNNKLYIFTKNWLNAQTNIYELPKTPGDYSISQIDSINSQGLISGATFNSANNSIMLCGYGVSGSFLVELKDFNNGLFSNGTINKINVAMPTNYSAQIEGISPINATDYYITNEESSSDGHGLFSFSTSTLNITSTNLTTMNFYPNPATNQITINKPNCIVKIYSILGELVLKTEKQQIDISNLNTGVYLIKIEDTNTKASTTKRLVISKQKST